MSHADQIKPPIVKRMLKRLNIQLLNKGKNFIHLVGKRCLNKCDLETVLLVDIFGCSFISFLSMNTEALILKPDNVFYKRS